MNSRSLCGEGGVSRPIRSLRAAKCAFQKADCAPTGAIVRLYLRVAAVWEAWPDSCTDTNHDTSIRRNTTWQRIHQSLASMRIAQRFRMSSTSCIKPGIRSEEHTSELQSPC